MAFKRNELTSSDLSKVLDYKSYLKTDDDQDIRRFKTPEGYFLNITRIDQTPEQKAISESIGRLGISLNESKNSFNKDKEAECQEKSVVTPSIQIAENEAVGPVPTSH
jgi:hypothetical protein